MDDVFLLSRIQFAMTIMFHYIFPPLSIGLGLVMVLMEGSYLRTGNIAYHHMTKLWSRLFAVNFAMGVATGIPMEFQFGTNWAAYARMLRGEPVPAYTFLHPTTPADRGFRVQLVY